MKYPKTRMSIKSKVRTLISCYTPEDAANMIVKLIQNNYRRRTK